MFFKHFNSQNCRATKVVLNKGSCVSAKRVKVGRKSTMRGLSSLHGGTGRDSEKTDDDLKPDLSRYYFIYHCISSGLSYPVIHIC